MNDKKLLKLKIEFCTVAVIFFVVLISCGFSFGWFSFNKVVTVDNMGVGVSLDGVNVEYRFYYPRTSTWSSWAPLSDTLADTTELIKYPGDSSIIQLKITNLSDHEVPITSLGFMPFDLSNSESPRIISEEVDGETVTTKYYYGTQITADCLYYSYIDENRTYLPADYVEDTIDKQFLFDKTTMDTSKLELYSGSDIIIDNGEFVIFAVKFIFEDFDESQDVYKNFGENHNEFCRRNIYVDFS